MVEDAVHRLTGQGYSASGIANNLGISERTVFAYRARIRDNGHEPTTKAINISPPKKREDLAPEVLAVLENTPEGFKAFVDRYWPEEPMPAHVFEFVKAAFDYGGEDGTGRENRGADEASSDSPRTGSRVGLSQRGNGAGHHGPLGHWKQRVVLNVPPNHAKTTTFSVRWAIWRICQNRDWQLILVSDTDDFAKQVAGDIATNLEMNEGLNEDFGQFRSDGPECLWQPGSGRIRVAGSGITRGYNILSRGARSQILGLRAHEVVCDDLVSPLDVLTEKSREELSHWFKNVIESRPFPGGIIRVIGTRHHLYDLYGELATAKGYHGEKKWEHTVFPAVLDWEEQLVLWDCEQNGKEHGESFPACCRSFEFLMREAYSSEAQFEQTYQQNPIPDEQRLVRREWIFGPEDSDDPNRGSLDRTRIAGPAVQPEDYIRVVSFDPSGGSLSSYAAIIVSDVLADRTEFRCVIRDIVREKMNIKTALEWLEVIFSEYRPQYFIPEWNAIRAAREMVDFDTLLKAYGVRLQGHNTSNNKNHTTFGVESLAGDFEFGRIRLPWGDQESRGQSNYLISEAMDYPFGRTDDCLMALWFQKWNLQHLRLPGGATFHIPVPPRLQGVRWVKT
jgi:hypothetical protein